jgi:acyl-CoA thioester hydrolase
MCAQGDQKMFEFSVRVYWEDTDAGGIVFYANYLKFMERARTEWLRSLGVEQQALKERTGGMFVVTETQLKYLSPARLDDVLLVSAEIIEKGRARLTIKQEISLYPANNLRGVLLNQEFLNLAQTPESHAHGMTQPVCEGTICIAWVDAASLKPGRIPQDILEVLI